MRKILFILSTLLTTSLCASVLQPILSGDFAPLTLSVQEQDSILNTASEPGRYTLEYENAEQLFRHSFVADWYIVDKTRNTRKQLGAALNLGKVRDAVLSPNGRYIAFAKDNNLYIHKLDFGTEVAVTKDANLDIINGIADWLYEEEFGITTLFAWSPDSKQLAFIRLDETQVPSFEWQTFLGNAVNENNATYPQYPSSASLRYP
ncbi:MAG: DPP IV N-terminal domain-containing protein, partial [Paludibacteraceae bacterium]|nr:DPP IV N-terminal domain-containing protein [Paludibacteraceae bacterium]